MKRILLLSLLSLMATTNILAMKTEQTLESFNDAVKKAVHEAQFSDKYINGVNLSKLNGTRWLSKGELEKIQLPSNEQEKEAALTILKQFKYVINSIAKFTERKTVGLLPLQLVLRFDNKSPLVEFKQKAQEVYAGDLGKNVIEYLKGATDVLTTGEFTTTESKKYVLSSGAEADSVPFNITDINAPVPFYTITNDYFDIANKVANANTTPELQALQKDFVKKYESVIGGKPVYIGFLNKWANNGSKDYLNNIIDTLITILQHGGEIPTASTDLNKSITALCTDLKELHAQTNPSNPPFGGARVMF